MRNPAPSNLLLHIDPTATTLAVGHLSPIGVLGYNNPVGLSLLEIARLRHHNDVDVNDLNGWVCGG